MTKCDETLRTIDLHSTGLASLSEIDQDHLKNCSDCATEFWRSDSFRRALEEYSHDLERQSDGIEAQILSRLDSGELPKGDETPSSSFRIRWPQIATFAAALFLVTLTFWQLLPPAAPRFHVDRSFLDRIEKEAGKSAMVRYLENSRQLVASLWEIAEECPEGQIRIEEERRLAKDLLLHRRLLKAQFEEPGYEEIKQLVNELEVVFLDVAGSEQCIDPDQIMLWQEVLERRSTLMKLNLLSAEAAI